MVTVGAEHGPAVRGVFFLVQDGHWFRAAAGCWDAINPGAKIGRQENDAVAVPGSAGTAAEALRALDRGTIRAGKLADLVIVRGNLAENIAAIREIEQVMLNGVLYERAQLLKEASRWALEQQ